MTITPKVEYQKLTFLQYQKNASTHIYQFIRHTVHPVVVKRSIVFWANRLDVDGKEAEMEELERYLHDA